MNESPEYKKQYDGQKNRDHKIGADIYSLAMISLLNPHEIKITEKEASKNYYAPIDMTRCERNNVF